MCIDRLFRRFAEFIIHRRVHFGLFLTGQVFLILSQAIDAQEVVGEDRPMNGLCAAACAYAIIYPEIRPDLTPEALISELPGAAQGNVRLRDLVDYLAQHGLNTRVIRGMTPEKLKQVGWRHPVHVMPITGAMGESSRGLDHIILFVRTDQNNDLVFVDTDRLLLHSDASLGKRWSGGYTLLAAENEADIDALIGGLNSQRNLLIYVCIITAIGGGALLFMILSKRSKIR
ncbi:MAG: hypothetical protein AAF333_08850 [Planctomycetota bacterium]